MSRAEGELSDVEKALLERMQRTSTAPLPAAPQTPAAPRDGVEYNSAAKKKGAAGCLGAVSLAVWKLWAMVLPVLLKLKAVLVALKFAKFAFIAKTLLVTGGTMLASMWVWSWMFGWLFAVGFVVGIFVHEMGHCAAAAVLGIPVSAPMFIPGFGAFIRLKGRVLNAKQDAFIGLAGPYAGSAFGLLCLLAFTASGSPYWAGLAYFTMFINLWNLVPMYPLDGGRAAVALSPWLWVVGAVVLVFVGGFFNPFLIMILLMSIPTMIAIFKKKGPYAHYMSISPQDRAWIAIAYFGLAALLAFGMHEVHNMLARHHGAPGSLI